VKRVPLNKHLPDTEVITSATLDPKEEKELLDFLNKNKDVFALSASDLRGVSCGGTTQFKLFKVYF